MRKPLGSAVSVELGVLDEVYVELLARYLDGRQDAARTRQGFYSLYQSDARVGDGERYAILQRVFLAFEDAVLDSDLGDELQERDEGDLDEPALRAVLAAAAHDLAHRVDDWESRAGLIRSAPASREAGLSLSADLPELAQLLGGGFNQDFLDVFGSPEDVVSIFTRSHVFAARLPGEVDRLLARYHGAELDRALLELGTGYGYAEDGLSAQEWLAEVVAQVEREKPAPDPTYRELVGQTVTGVVVPPRIGRIARWRRSARSARDPGPRIAVILTEHVITFAAGAGCSSTGGAGPVVVGRDPSLLVEAVGEQVLSVGVSSGRLWLATPHVSAHSLPVDEGPGFEVARRLAPGDS